MISQSSADHRPTRVRALVVRAFAIAMLMVSVASADNIDKLISDLDNSSDRVRLTAVLSLTSQQSPRAIDALARKLGDTGEQKNIRGLAATALGRTVLNGKPSAAQKKKAIAALSRAKSDPEPFVSAKAEAALDQIGDTGGGGGGGGGANGVYVNVGPMSSKTGTDDKRLRDRVHKTAVDTLVRVAPSFRLTWPGGRAPTQQMLDSKGIAGFYVDGTLNELKVEKSGNSAKVSCKVSMLLASFPSKSVFGLLNGGAAVQGSSSDREIALAQQDCVMAVVEDLIAKKIVPTIKAKVP